MNTSYNNPGYLYELTKKDGSAEALLAEAAYGLKKKDAAFIFKKVNELKREIYKKLEISSGIDLHLSGQAKHLGKPIEDLETEAQYEQQKTTMALLQDDPIERLFLKILSGNNEDMEMDKVIGMLTEQLSLKFKELLQPMFDAWEEGNLNEFDDPKSSVEKKMDMIQRNMNMARKIVESVKDYKDKDRIFCCVGAAHTVGNMNVQAFLNSFGYTTKRVLV
jgi:uncharacterized protein YbaP (TraB family)